jgi:hypothetical protein
MVLRSGRHGHPVLQLQHHGEGPGVLGAHGLHSLSGGALLLVLSYSDGMQIKLSALLLGRHADQAVGLGQGLARHADLSGPRALRDDEPRHRFWRRRACYIHYSNIQLSIYYS